MFVEQPPLLYRLLFPEAVWRLKQHGRLTAYLTFDDGPIPEVTPWVLDTLAQHEVKGTFFMVGDNVRRHPELLGRIRAEGHSTGNHTMHHLRGFRTLTTTYLRDLLEADDLIGSPLFRPPHGILRWKQAARLKRRFNLVMYDVISCDYSKSTSPQRVVDNVTRHVRNGSIIVFHDSLKAERNLRYALPRVITWLKDNGYELFPLPM